MRAEQGGAPVAGVGGALEPAGPLERGDLAADGGEVEAEPVGEVGQPQRAGVADVAEDGGGGQVQARAAGRRQGGAHLAQAAHELHELGGERFGGGHRTSSGTAGAGWLLAASIDRIPLFRTPICP